MRTVGTRVPRVNDAKLLRGRGRYVDDIDLPGMLHAAVVRSPAAHGALRSVVAPPLPAGAAFLGPADLEALVRADLPIVWRLGDQRAGGSPLLDGRVRYVGQPVAVVGAPSRYEAEDLAEQAEVVVDELPAVVDVEAALSPGAPVLHPDIGSNVLCTFDVGDDEGHVEQVFAAAEEVLSTRIRMGRLSGLPMEPRGVVAVPADRKLTVHVSTQAVHAVRDAICETLGFAQRDVRVLAPDVGGGFGLKDHLYEDELMVIAAAVHLGRPVKWIEDRTESMLATTHARDETHDVEVAFDRDGRLRGLRVHSRRNAGGRFAIFGGGPLFTALSNLPGPYRWDAVRGVGQLVATTTMTTGAYRGFGQTQAALIRERSVDLVARALDRHPADLRAQNMIGPDELPYTTRTLVTFDNGDYPLALGRARELIEAADAPPDDGRARGIGYCSYVQMAGLGPSFMNELIGLEIGGYESANVRVEPDGTVRFFTGVSPHGQGQETTLAQLVADELGVEVGDVEVVHGDTDSTPYSAYGTAASRSIAVGGGAAVVAAGQVAAKIRAIAAEMLEANPDDIELVDGRAKVVGTQIGVAVADVARRAWQGFRLPDGMEPGLVAGHVYDPTSPTFSYATHACRAAVDRDTGQVEIEDYVVVHDCGTIVNPTIVEGQIHGGIAQGLGAALLEEVRYNDDGQPLSATLLDYHAPVSASIPDIRIEHLEIPSPYTPGGMKGMGEGGTNGAYACVVNAVAAALPDLPGDELATPLTAPRIWEALHRMR